MPIHLRSPQPSPPAHISLLRCRQRCPGAVECADLARRGGRGGGARGRCELVPCVAGGRQPRLPCHDGTGGGVGSAAVHRRCNWKETRVPAARLRHVCLTFSLFDVVCTVCDPPSLHLAAKSGLRGLHGWWLASTCVSIPELGRTNTCAKGVKAPASKRRQLRRQAASNLVKSASAKARQ
jgi:hypothetical protein